jgi:transitional endoplasmic reticulum ATPase
MFQAFRRKCIVDQSTNYDPIFVAIIVIVMGAVFMAPFVIWKWMSEGPVLLSNANVGNSFMVHWMIIVSVWMIIMSRGHPMLLLLPMIYQALMIYWSHRVSGEAWGDYTISYALMAGELIVMLGGGIQTYPLEGNDEQAEFAGRQKALRQSPDSLCGEVDSSGALPISKPRRTFNHIYGMESVKKRLGDAGAEIIKKRTGSGTPRNGILLFGKPGNGKTVFAEALAGTLGLPMITVTAGDIASRWINQSTEQLVEAFEFAKAKAPCVLFIDELDSLLGDRSASSGNDETSRMVNTLLTEIVSLRDFPVIFIGATNYIERLDAAGIREGRIDYKIEVTPPDEPARIGILKHSIQSHLPNIPVDEAAIVSAAKRWEGFSVKRIQAVGEELADVHKETPLNSVDYVILMKALRRLQGRAGTLPANAKGLRDLMLDQEAFETLNGIAMRLQDPLRTEKLGGTLPTGILFYGPPGTGKTTTAQALAKDANWALLSLNGHDVAADPKKLDKVYAEALELRPVCVFIDEADDLITDRRYSGVGMLTNKLLTMMDGAGGQIKDVLWIAATNNPEALDAAALRGGRFTEKVEFRVPDANTLATYVRQWIGKRNFKLDFDPSAIDQALAGESVANINEVLQQTVNTAISRNSGDACVTLSMDHFQRAKRLVLGN